MDVEHEIILGAILGIIAMEIIYGTQAENVRFLGVFLYIPIGGAIFGVIAFQILKALFMLGIVVLYIAAGSAIIFVIYKILEFLYNTVLWTNPV